MTGLGVSPALVSARVRMLGAYATKSRTPAISTTRKAIFLAAQSPGAR